MPIFSTTCCEHNEAELLSRQSIFGVPRVRLFTSSTWQALHIAYVSTCLHFMFAMSTYRWMLFIRSAGTLWYRFRRNKVPSAMGACRWWIDAHPEDTLVCVVGGNDFRSLTTTCSFKKNLDFFYPTTQTMLHPSAGSSQVPLWCVVNSLSGTEASRLLSYLRRVAHHIMK